MFFVPPCTTSCLRPEDTMCPEATTEEVWNQLSRHEESVLILDLRLPNQPGSKASVCRSSMLRADKMLSVVQRYVVSLALVFFALMVSTTLPSPADATSLFIILSSIVCAAWYGGLGAGLLSIVLATLGIDHFLMEPRYSFTIASISNMLRLMLFAITSCAIVLFISSRQVVLARLARSNEELNALAARMDLIREDERARLGREIHDELGGTLSILKLDVAAIQKHSQHDPTIHDKTTDLLKEIDGAIVQRITMELRPPLLDHAGLAAGIESYLDSHCRRIDLTCEKDIDPNVTADNACLTAVFRVFQEAFTNVVRHAKATKLTVHLKEDQAHIRLVIRDNGIGITPHQIQKPDAFGLIGMRERMRPFDSSVNIVGQPGEGTTVTVIIPIGCAKPRAVAKA
jgi:signal transduction histidine kinase